MKEAAEARRIRAARGGRIEDRTAGEESGPHAAYPVERQRHALGARLCGNAIAEPAADLLQLLVRSWALQGAQAGQASRHRERIPGERSCLVDGALWRNLCHQVAASAVGAYRQPSADDLAQGGDVGPDGVAVLGA